MEPTARDTEDEDPWLAEGAWRIRAPRGSDTAFVLHSWRRSRAPFISHKREIGYWRGGQDEITAALLERGRVVVACETTNPDRILGWACGEKDGDTALLHWVYVRKECRGRGMASILCDALVGFAKGEVIVTSTVRRYDRLSDGTVEPIDLGPAIERRGWRVCVHGACYCAAAHRRENDRQRDNRSNGSAARASDGPDRAHPPGRDAPGDEDGTRNS